MKLKRLVIVGVVVAVILGGVTLIKPKTIEYVKGDTEVVEKTIEIETLQKRIDDAKVAEEMNTEATAYKMYLQTRAQIEKEIELKVTNEYKTEIDAKITELEKQVSL